jgi:hypothetical protein
MHSPGIEPGTSAWKADILPLNYECFDTLDVDSDETLGHYLNKGTGIMKYLACKPAQANMEHAHYDTL